MAKISMMMALSMMALAISLSVANTEAGIEQQYPSSFDPSDHGSSSLRLPARALAQYSPSRAAMTCDNFPRVCRTKGSPGPDCCRKQCVDVDSDGLNCGQCGRRCRYGEACCGGKCVSVMADPKNCGVCRNKCRGGGLCSYGMCSYA